MPKRKQLIFGEGFLFPVLSGNQKMKISKYREGVHDFTRGETVYGEFVEGLNLLLVITADTELKTINEISDEEACMSGYTNVQGMIEVVMSTQLKSDILAINRFEVYSKKGDPAVEINEYGNHLKRGLERPRFTI